MTSNGLNLSNVYKEHSTCTYFAICTSNSQNREILYLQNFIYASKNFLPEFSLSQREYVDFSMSFLGFH